MIPTHPEEAAATVLDPALKEILLTLIKTIADPFLLTGLVVVFLMYRLLQRKENTFDNSMKDVFNELHAMSRLLTEQAATIQTMVEMRRHDKEEKEREREAN